MNDQVERMLLTGADKRQVEDALISAGWSEKAAKARLSRWVMTELGPVEKPNTRAPDIIKGVAGLLILIMICWHLTAVSFEIVENILPSPYDEFNMRYWRPAVFWSLSNLMVLFPLYMWFTRRFGRISGWARSLGKTLVIAVFTGSAISLLNAFMNGGLTSQFAVKVMALCVVTILANHAIGGDDEA